MDYKERELVIKEYQDLYAPDLQELKDNFYSIFPNGKISAQVFNGIGDPTLGISFYMIGERTDQSHNIVDNDPVHTKFIAHLPKIHPTKETKFKVEYLMGGLSVKPEEGSFMAMGRVKLPYRKSTGDISKQVKNLTKYFKKVGQAVIDNKDNLYKKDLKSKYLTINV
jgi:hypothetical protein